jgi:CHAD domain-containing protein/CYTH domain-containing protein
MKLTRALLERSAEETVRHLALGLLRDADAALERMDDSEDPEALHDFRVALRRLRSVLRAYRPYLKGSVPKKLRTRLRTLAASTNVARDTEVQLEWLTSAKKDFDEVERAGAERLTARIRDKQRTAPARAQLASEFHSVRRGFAKALSRMRLRIDEPSQNFVRAAAGLVETQAGALERSLAPIRSAAEADALHDARIEAKRLRYLLEPLKPVIPKVQGVIKAMKSLQDLLGDLQDARVLIEEISGALEEVALEQARQLRELAFREATAGSSQIPDQSGGNEAFLAMLKLQGSRVERGFDKLSSEWLGGASSTFFDEIESLVRSLRFWPDEEPGPRRFLLSRVPDMLHSQRGRSYREGFLPGREILEKVSSERTGTGVVFLRRVSSAATSTSIEEKISRRSFEQLWPLTEGRRLERTRYEVVENDTHYFVDDFRGRDLVIAEIPSSSDAPIPEWLEPVIVLEITGVAEYEPERLARSARPPAIRPTGRKTVTTGRSRSAPETPSDPKAESQ